MYLLFMYEEDRPDGGRGDFIKSCVTLKECIDFFKKYR